MKNIVIAIMMTALSCSYSFSSDDFENHIIFNKKYEYIITKSCEEIYANMDIMLSIYTELDAAIGTTWRVSVAKKIPSQPVAAIRLLSKAGVKPERYCMDPFIEADDITLKTWLESSIEALESFTMNNAKEELFRCECLGEIKSGYADFSQK